MPNNRPAHRSGGVYLRLGEAENVNAPVVQLGNGLNRHNLGPGDALERPDHERVPLAKIVEARDPLRPLRDAARLAVVDEHVDGAGRLQLTLLGVETRAPSR